ncbi:hypothetical protein THAOC_36156 [Thalassiosira oceanica]|uniref:Uncharacterized protein n=1 Tax=Thalassiosira oceanica TaxID=159749 RepID=K0R0Q0_THAOC|nr:hypothetical protein THAOC_36156 [Thalassiosira oceanica]|eukprot:EJK45235.1 hypothetical protein THAOC_36156 [Thalassiosira oceanica]
MGGRATGLVVDNTFEGVVEQEGGCLRSVPSVFLDEEFSWGGCSSPLEQLESRGSKLFETVRASANPLEEITAYYQHDEDVSTDPAIRFAAAVSTTASTALPGNDGIINRRHQRGGIQGIAERLRRRGLDRTPQRRAGPRRHHKLHPARRQGPGDEDAKTFGSSNSSTVAAGAYLLLCRDVDFDFGVGGDDTVSLLDGAGEVVSVASLDGGGGDDATLALFPGTGYRYTETATPGGGNVLTEPRPLEEKLAEQNDAGGAFFLDDEDDGGEISFAKVVDVHVQVSNESLALIKEHPTWEEFVPFSEFRVSNPSATGESNASQLSTGGGGKIRTKGQSTLMITACLGLANVPFQIEFDTPWHGMEVVYLRNHLGDASYMRDYASHVLLKRFGLPYLRSRPVRLYLNGEYVGFYTLMEAPTQGYVMQRSFGVFDPTDTALYKVKTTLAQCPITEESTIAKTQGEAVPDPYYFERGDHRLDPPFGSDVGSCYAYFLGEIGKEADDLNNGILNEYNNSCGEALVGLGRVDRDYGPKSTEAGMEKFINSVLVNASRTDIKDAIDADQWIKNFAAYAVTMNHDSILGNVNNLYLATTDDGASWSIVQYDHNNIATRGGGGLCSEACAYRFIFQPILRPTCGAVEEHIILGRILNDNSSWEKYLNYVQEFARVLEFTIGDLRLYGHDIKSFIVSDPLANGVTEASYEKSELGLDYSDYNSQTTPLLKTLSARLEQVNAQLIAIESETMPRDGTYDENEKCPDWRDSEGTSYMGGSAFDDSCGIPWCEDAAPCYDDTPFTCVNGNLVIEECKPAGNFCGPCFPYSTCGSGVQDDSSKFVTGDSCGEELGGCELGAGCFGHKSGICAYDGSIISEECREADVFCRECYPYSRCGSLKASMDPEVNDGELEYFNFKM